MERASMKLNLNHKDSKEKITSDILNYVHYLKSSGLARNDRVIITADNSYSFILTIFALVHIDCSIVFVDNSLNEKELLDISYHSDAQFCITDKLIEKDNKLIEILSLPFDIPTDKLLSGRVCVSNWEKRRDALILYTSGSTGEPKGIIKSGESFLINLKSTIKRMGYNNSDVLLPLIPFTHFYGLSLIFIWWIQKCALVLCDYRKTTTIPEEIIKNKVTIVDAVPSTYYILNRLLSRREKILQNIRNSSIRMWCVGGSPLSRKLNKEFSEHIGMPILDGYGSSEAGNVSFNTSGPDFGCGKAIDGVQVKIVDNDGKELPLGELGEIIVKSPGIMERYYQLEEKSNLILKNGWLLTNDLGYLDSQENLFVIGRKGDEIIRNGYIIYPSNVEKTLEDQLGIKSKVVSFKDERKGSSIILLVESISEPQILKKKINALLDAISRPDRIYIVAKFPYLNNGKVDYKSLKKLACSYKEAVSN